MREKFNFEQYIGRFVHPQIPERQEKRGLISVLSDWLAQRYANKYLLPLELQREEDNRHYNIAKRAFEDMFSQGRVEIEHKRFANNVHKLTLTGSGIQDFRLNDEPRYYISDDYRVKSSSLSVDMGSRKGEIIFHDYPSSKKSLGIFSKITLDYHFSTEVSLGGDVSCEGQTFTDNPNQRAENLGNRRIGFFYGAPGKVLFRFGDAISNELQRAVLATWHYNDVERDKLRVWGEASLEDEVIYQGNFSVKGSFPFYIDEDRDGSFPRKPTPTLVDVK